jgi:putative hydrolase of the HAD superfamily
VAVFDGIRAVLFDMGDTLVEYPLPGWPTLVGQAIDALYTALVRPEELPPPAADLPGPEEASAHRSPAGPETALLHRATVGLRRVIRAVSGRTLPRMAEACARPAMAQGRVYPDTLAALQALRARGYRMGLVSNTPWGTPDYLWEKQVARFGLTEFLQVRVFSSGIGFRKPDPRIFLAALARLRSGAEETLFVGDHPLNDVAGPRRMGMRTAWIVRRHPRRKVHGTAADVWVRSLAELLDYLPPRRL